MAIHLAFRAQVHEIHHTLLLTRPTHGRKDDDSSGDDAEEEHVQAAHALVAHDEFSTELAKANDKPVEEATCECPSFISVDKHHMLKGELPKMPPRIPMSPN